MAFKGIIEKARVLSIDEYKGGVKKLFISWSERVGGTKDAPEFGNVNMDLTVFQADELDVKVQDVITVNGAKIRIRESEDWRRGYVGEELTEEHKGVKFVDLTTVGDLIEVTESGDPTYKKRGTKKSSVPKKTSVKKSSVKKGPASGKRTAKVKYPVTDFDDEDYV